MNSNELMIGDLVMYNPNVFIEDEYEHTHECYVERISSGEDIDLAIDGCFYPIPLTPEILEKNGFDIHETLGEWHPSVDGFRFINKYSDEPLEIDACGLYVEIRYVHQLQHALRLCGLNDLADNFKV